MKHKITWKLAACFGAALLVFSIVTGTVFIVLFRQHTIGMRRGELEEQAKKFAEMISSSGGGWGMGYGPYFRLISSIDHMDIWIVDENLRLMTPVGHKSHHDPESLTYQDLPPDAEDVVERVFAGETTFSEDFSSLLSVPTLTVGAPILLNDGTVSGAVLLHSPVSWINDAVGHGVLALVIGIGCALALTAILSCAFSYSFTKPLKRMNQAALRLANGDYAAQTGVKQNDEIGQLARTLDNLAGRLDAASKESERLEQMRRDFVANVSHELRTPVTVLRGSLEALRDGVVQEPDQVREYHEQMLTESLHMQRLVNDLLDLSRLQNADFALESEPFSLCGVVSDAARSMRRAAQTKQVEITADCPEEDCMFTGDYNRIRQMLIILLDNAVKFSPEGETVSVRLTKENGRTSIRIEDHGCGIPPSELENIFERFHKSNSAINKNGTGLGLAIAKQIAERHQIVISVSSEPGKGTVFQLNF